MSRVSGSAEDRVSTQTEACLLDPYQLSISALLLFFCHVSCAVGRRRPGASLGLGKVALSSESRRLNRGQGIRLSLAVLMRKAA